MQKIVAGLDEAGRGPVIGPLVIGCVMYREEDLPILEEIGVDDSKKLSPKHRTHLAEQIKGSCLAHKVKVITAEEINKLHFLAKLTLNQIEERAFAALLNEMTPRPDIIYLDACDTKEDRFGRTIQAQLKFKPDRVVSKHRGDAIFKVVGAGSILAKTVRDSVIEEYQRQYGDLGSGYPSDPKTRNFLNAYYREHRDFPPIVRTWWKTAENIVKKYRDAQHQKKLTDF
jgi:ribonuclease HII